MDITPTNLPVLVPGGFDPRYFSKIHDPFHSRAIAVDNGVDRFVFATIDTCVLKTEFTDAIKAIVHEKSGYSVDRICISATHTHSAPALQNTFKDAKGEDPEYVKMVKQKTAEAILAAIENLQPAKVGWGITKERRHAFCRRIFMKPGTAMDLPSAFTGITSNLVQLSPPKSNPNRITWVDVPDTNVYVIAFKTLDGKPLAVLSNYSVHYAGGPHFQDSLSADYYGVFAKRLGEKLAAPEGFVAMMTNGTSGDGSCNNYLDPNQPRSDLDIVGEHVAEDVLELYNKLAFKEWVPLRVSEQELTLGLRRASADEARQAEEYLAKLEKNNEKGDVTTVCYARHTIASCRFPPTRTIKIQAIGIGGFGICTIPSEIYLFTGHNIRSYTPYESSFIVSLANGSNGYVPPIHHFAIGGYTTWRGSSNFVPESEPLIRAKCLAMLEELYRMDNDSRAAVEIR